MLSPKPYGKTMPYTPAYQQDIEKGLSSPTKIAKRIVSRKPRWILGIFIVGAVVFYFYETGSLDSSLVQPPPPPPVHHHGPPLADDGKGWRPGDEWDEHDDNDDNDSDEDDEEDGNGWKDWLPFGSNKNEKPSKPLDAEEETEPEYSFIEDNNGGHYITNFEQDIAPLHPDLSKLPPASSILAEIDLKEKTIPPREDIYPDEELRLIISPKSENEEKEEIRNTIPEDSWAKMWKGPEDWIGEKGHINKVQWSGFASGRDRWESNKEKKVREERRDAVKRGFKHAWEAYKRHAWGHDEVRPVSQTPSDPFNGWGATIVDSLDTILLMGLTDEYNLCRPHVNQLNFHWVNGRDWNSSYVTEEDENGDVFGLSRDRSVGLPVFETGIRYLGGLLGGYDLSGDKLLVERAEDLAEVLGKAFNTVSGLPMGRVDPGIGENQLLSMYTVSIAEVGSMSLELIRLSQITKNRKWFDLAQRAMEYIEERVIPRTSQTPLIPLWIQPDSSLEHVQTGQYAFGGLADSYYEYLVKTYKLLGNNAVSQIWRRVYERSIDKAKELLYRDIDVVPDRKLFTIGKFENGGGFIPELEHLTCFAGAMLGLGAKLLDRPEDMVDAEKITSTCYWLSADTPTGLQPETTEWYKSTELEIMYENRTLETNELYRLPLTEEEIENHNNGIITISGIHKDMSGILRWNNDGTIVKSRNPSSDPIKYYSKLKGNPTGSKKVSTRGLNRPETIESIFYMYRLTGDRKWQEKGWKMFVSWMDTAKVDGGISSVNDVTKEKGQVSLGDNMESFALAETFKYHFLLQSEPDVMSLDDYVLNTEAHPLLVNPKLDPTSSTSHVRYWTPQPNQDIGVRGQGTNVQKFTRKSVIERVTGSRHPPTIQHYGNAGPGSGGGRGMGGGGGKPGDRPKPPAGFGNVNGMKKITSIDEKNGDGEGEKINYPDDF